MNNQPLIPENLNISTESISECLKTISNIGSTVHQNVCNGASATVPWGSLDWILAILLTTLLVGMIGWLIWVWRDLG